MNTHIFVWNPKIWDWYYIEDSIKQIEQSGKTEERWGCGNTKSIKAGDRVILNAVKMRSGQAVIEEVNAKAS